MAKRIVDMLYCVGMSTVTIPKTKYEILKKEAAAYRRILATPRAALHTLAHKPNKIGGKQKGTAKKLKKLPAGLRQALREVEQGKLSGPFETVDELMAHLRQ